MPAPSYVEPERSGGVPACKALHDRCDIRNICAAVGGAGGARAGEQIGKGHFEAGKAILRLRPEDLRKEIRGWLVVRLVDDRWLITAARVEGARVKRPYRPRFAYKFFLGGCDRPDYGRAAQM